MSSIFAGFKLCDFEITHCSGYSWMATSFAKIAFEKTDVECFLITSSVLDLCNVTCLNLFLYQEPFSPPFTLITIVEQKGKHKCSKFKIVLQLLVSTLM